MQTSSTVGSRTRERCWCGGRLATSVHEEYGTCTVCSTQVSRYTNTPEELKNYYTLGGYWHDAMKTVYNLPSIEQRAESDFRDRIPAWYELVKNAKPDCSRLLEIGCAHGGFLGYCKERGMRTVVGVEVDEDTCRFARQRFGLEHVYSGLFPDVKLPFETFDVIVAFDVMEHVLEPVRVVSAIRGLLANNGLCILQTPCYRGEGRDWGMFIPKEHFFLYTEQSGRRLLDIAGLEPVAVLPGVFPQDMFLVGCTRASGAAGGGTARQAGGLRIAAPGTPAPPTRPSPPAAPPATVPHGKLRCWCGGTLGPSVHPLYGACPLCGTLVLRKQMSEDELRGYYTKDGYWHDQMVNEYKFPPIEERAKNDFQDRIPVWYELLSKVKPDTKRLLEIGCAHGGFLHYARQKGVSDVVGVEVDEATCAFACSHFGLEHVVSGLFPDVALPFDRFDAITGFDLVEHFRDPLTAFFSVNRMLSDDGIFIFQTPCYRNEKASWPQFRPREHLFLYNEKSIRQMLEISGLHVWAIVPGFFPDDMFVVGGGKPLDRAPAPAVGQGTSADASPKTGAPDRGPSVPDAQAPAASAPSVERTAGRTEKRILVDGVMFQIQANGHGGISRIWKCVLPELMKAMPEAEFVLLKRAQFDPGIPGIRVREIPAYSFRDLDADDSMLADVCRQERADLFLSTYYSRAPGFPCVQMVYDMIPEEFPGLPGWDRNGGMWISKQRAFSSAHSFIAISESTRNDLARLRGLVPDSVTVAYPAIGASFGPATPAEMQAAKRAHGLAAPYFLLVGHRSDYKNALTALRGFMSFSLRDSVRIAAVGGPAQLDAREKPFAHVLQPLGAVTDEELRALYAGALALLYPSKYEGFGIPVVEAMACGCPVITTQSSSLPEAGGDACLYADAEDPASFCKAMEDVLDPTVRDRLVESGKSQAARFTWKSMAERIRQHVAPVLASGPSDRAPLPGAPAAAAPAIIVRSPDDLPTISIVTPSYNQALYLEECMDSILSQGYPKLEYIVLDGGSTDRSVDIIKKRQKHLAFWQSKPDGGHYAAVDAGIKRSKGDVLAWLNSDDKLHPGALWVVGSVFARFPHVQWVMGRPTVWDEIGRLKWVLKDLPLWSRQKYLEGRYGNPHIQQESTFWRRSLWDAAGGGLDTSLALAGDLELWTRFFRHAQLYTVDTFLGGFRSHPQQQTATKLVEYDREAQQVIRRERALFDQSTDKKLPPAPAPISVADIVREGADRLFPEAFGFFTYARKSHFHYFEQTLRDLNLPPVNHAAIDLKVYQDLLALTFIRQNVPRGARILEVGGGDSRVLPVLGQEYECWNLDKLEGEGNGPTAAHAANYRLIKDYIGAFSPELPKGYFDCVFSISALEHVPESEEVYRGVCADIDRVLKDGGLSLHLFDVRVKPVGGWTNGLARFMAGFFSTVNPLIPLNQILMDPDAYFLPEENYRRFWQPVTKMPIEEFGRPTSYNLLWRKNGPRVTAPVISAFVHARGAEDRVAAGDMGGAEEHLKQSLESVGDFTPALAARGALLARRGERTRALELLRSTLGKDPSCRGAVLALLDIKDTPDFVGTTERLAFQYLDINRADVEVQRRLVAAQRAYFDRAIAECVVVDANYEQRDYLVTALVSAYASEAFMDECLHDLEAQTVADKLEIIVIDAASPENERGIVEKYQKSHSNIRYLRTRERIGVYPAWNLAIHAARGKFLTPFSTNDRLVDKAYEVLSGHLRAHADVALVYGDSWLTDLPHQRIGSHQPPSTGPAEWRWPEYSYLQLLRSCMVGPHPMWRREIHDTVGYFDGRYSAIGDQDFWLRLGRSHNLRHIAEFTGLVWQTADSLSGDRKRSDEELKRVRARHQQFYLRESCLKALPEPPAPPVGDFMDTIIGLVEKKDNVKALDYYRRFRKCYQQDPELAKFDALVNRVNALVK